MGGVRLGPGRVLFTGPGKILCLEIDMQQHLIGPVYWA